MFVSENELVNQFMKYPIEENNNIIFEFGVGYGIADVIYYDLDCSVLYNRIKELGKDVIIDQNLVRIVNYLSEHGATHLNELERCLYINKQSLKYNYLKKLLSNNFVKSTEEDTYQATISFRPFVKNIIAIEAKLKDWKAGYKQARRYLHFAHKVYLAIDQEYAHRVDRDILMKDNIGLLIVNDNKIEEEIAPISSSPKDYDMYLLANEKIFQHLLECKENQQILDCNNLLSSTCFA
ncbi:hypothetical protein [Bacillus cereus]|uniref:hypothetical protein n=1 Tax=Bacillus cereus TaxID=1396 RepID=UPI000D10E4EB|nr:hypothetical protein [Bacillus cereus]AVP43756.1 hypothetical protein C2I25_00890 [Bacillus cereus]